MTKKRKRLKKRIRELERKIEQLNQAKNESTPFDKHLDEFEREIQGLGPEIIDGKVLNAYLLLIYIELINYARSISRLTTAGTQSNTPYLILRGMLEGLADLTNLVCDESTLDSLMLRYRKERRKVLNNAKQGNPYLKGLVDDGLDDLIKEQEQAIKELEESGAKDKMIWEKFKDADLTDEYEGWYAFFSGFVHRGLRTLETRHLHQDEDGNWVFPPDLERDWTKSEVEKFQASIDFILRDARSVLVKAGLLND